LPISANPDVWKKSSLLRNVSSPPSKSITFPMSCGTKNIYSQALLSNVSDGLEVSEQKSASGLQAIGSWYPHVAFKYFGWKKPVKFVSTPLMDDFWSGLKRFCQFADRARYFEYVSLPSPSARVARLKSL
jgi:hypothetical protein